LLDESQGFLTLKGRVHLEHPRAGRRFGTAIAKQFLLHIRQRRGRRQLGTEDFLKIFMDGAIVIHDQ
jgi:hypothetical protein